MTSLSNTVTELVQSHASLLIQEDSMSADDCRMKCGIYMPSDGYGDHYHMNYGLGEYDG